MSKSGTYKGQPADPDSVKFKTEFQGIPIHVDRPKGFKMEGADSKGKPWKRTYKMDYGFIPKTQGGDGDELDVFIGPNKASKDVFWALQHKPDGTFDEYKVFLGFGTKAEARTAYEAHIPASMLKSIIPMKLDFLKTLLGVSPQGLAKTSAVLDELQNIDIASLRNSLF